MLNNVTQGIHYLINGRFRASANTDFENSALGFGLHKILRALDVPKQSFVSKMHSTDSFFFSDNLTSHKSMHFNWFSGG